MPNNDPKSLANELSQSGLVRDCRNSDLDRYEVKPGLFNRILAFLSAEPPQALYEEIGTYCVWTKWGRRPQFFHPTLELAEAEAARLAALHPGRKFIVMKMEGKFSVPADQPGEDTTEELAGEIVAA